MARAQTKAIEIFLSYAHEDEILLNALEKHLSTLKRQGLITNWHEHDINAGQERAHEIEAHLNAAQIILLLVSADFIAADYCYSVQMKRAMERHRAGTARVIPIILRPCNWQGTPFEQLQALPSDGKPITRWSNRDEAFVVVAEGIRAVVEGLRPQHPSGTSSFPITNIPYERNFLFTGREGVLESLYKSLRTGRTTVLTQAISGIGGIGKTQTAIEYAYRYQDDYEAMLWMSAESRETLLADTSTIAELLKLPERYEQEQAHVIKAFKRWLQEHESWLLILDNVDDFTIVQEILPVRARGHILLTTRTQITGRVAHRIDLERMGPDEGALFLLRRATLLDLSDPFSQAAPSDQATAKEIVRVMDGLPLALDQAGAYIEETRCGLEGYLALYQTRQADLLKRRGKWVTDHPGSVTTTLSLSFERVQQADPAAADLLRFCAFLDPDAIPEEIVTKGASQLGPFVLQRVEAEPDKLKEAVYPRESARC